MNLMFNKELQITIIYHFIVIAHYLICSIETSQLEQLNNKLTAKYLSTHNQSINQLEIKLTKWFNKLDYYFLKKSLNNQNLVDLNGLINKQIINSSNKHLDVWSLKNDEFNKLNTFYKQTNYKLNRLRKRRNENLIRNVSNNNFNELLNNLSTNHIKVTKSLDSDLDKFHKNNNNVIIKEEGLYEIPNFLVVLLTICYVSISLMAVFGNLIILLIVIKSKKMQNPTNYLLANLSASDFLIGAVAIPFQYQAALLQKWVLPPFFCAFCPTIQQISLNCSVLTIVALSLDRFRAVIWPLRTKTSRMKSKVIILIIWFTSIVFAVPTYLAYDVTFINDSNEYFCNNINISDEYWKLYTYILFLIQYFLPLCIILYAYLRIGFNLFTSDSRFSNGTSNRSDLTRMMKNKRRIIKMLFIMTIFFAGFWMPFQLYQVLCEIYPSINSYRYINLIFFSCHLLAMSNSICQPLILFIYSRKWRVEILYRFQINFICYGICEKCLPRNTIQRDRFNLNNNEHTTYTSNQNNTNIFQFNCTPNSNTNYSTNNLSTPNNRSNLDSNTLFDQQPIPEIIEFEHLNKLKNSINYNHLNLNDYKINSIKTISTSNSIQNKFNLIDNYLQFNLKTNLFNRSCLVNQITKLIYLNKFYNLFSNLKNYLIIKLSYLIINQHQIKYLNSQTKINKINNQML